LGWGVLSLCLDEPRGRTPGRMLAFEHDLGIVLQVLDSPECMLGISYLPGMNGIDIHNIGQNAQSHDGDRNESGSSVILLS